MSRQGYFAQLAVVAALLGFGCGGGSDDEITVETGALSKPKFIKRADAICKESNDKVVLAGLAYLRGVEKSDSPFATQQQEAPKYVEAVLVPEMEGQIDRISQLGAPKGDEARVAAVLRALRGALETASAEPVEFVQSTDSFAKPERLARAYGFGVCGGVL